MLNVNCNVKIEGFGQTFQNSWFRVCVWVCVFEGGAYIVRPFS